MAFRFLQFKVYKDAKLLHIAINKNKLVSTFPRSYYYLIDQVTRCSLSIVLNIAEGSSKQSDKDFNRFLTIALGSIDETMACLDIAYELKLITNDECILLEKQLLDLSNQLGGFSKYLKNHIK